MALNVNDFLTPRGTIDGGLLFPLEQPADTAARINEYLAQGYTRAAKYPAATLEQKDLIAYAWVMYRTYDAVVDRMALTPASFSAADEGSVSYSSAQLKAMQEQRDKWLDTYNDLISGITETPTVSIQKQSAAIPTRYGW